MSYFDGMKYVTGSDGDHTNFAVPLSADDDGLLGRECPSDECSPKYFKIIIAAPDDEEAPSLSDISLTCPYCGHTDGFGVFHTQAQIEWATDLITREVTQAAARSLENALRPLNRMRGPIKLTAKVTTSLPPILQYVEEKLKRQTTCEQCHMKYAVYGVSYHCPFCGGGALSTHLRESVETIRVLAAEAETIGQKFGHEAGDKMLGNAYEDAVGLFEGFLKLVYRYGLRKVLPRDEAEHLFGKIGTAFQRLDDTARILQRDLSVELFRGVSDRQKAELAVVFNKRHLLTHSLGVVDQKYRIKVRAAEREGQDVRLNAREIGPALELIERVVVQAAMPLGL
jgi:hypothetical protein